MSNQENLNSTSNKNNKYKLVTLLLNNPEFSESNGKTYMTLKVVGNVPSGVPITYIKDGNKLIKKPLLMIENTKFRFGKNDWVKWKGSNGIVYKGKIKEPEIKNNKYNISNISAIENSTKKQNNKSIEINKLIPLESESISTVQESKKEILKLNSGDLIKWSEGSTTFTGVINQKNGNSYKVKNIKSTIPNNSIEKYENATINPGSVSNLQKIEIKKGNRVAYKLKNVLKFGTISDKNGSSPHMYYINENNPSNPENKNTSGKQNPIPVNNSRFKIINKSSINKSQKQEIVQEQKSVQAPVPEKQEFKNGNIVEWKNSNRTYKGTIYKKSNKVYEEITGEKHYFVKNVKNKNNKTPNNVPSSVSEKKLELFKNTIQQPVIQNSTSSIAPTNVLFKKGNSEFRKGNKVTWKKGNNTYTGILQSKLQSKSQSKLQSKLPNNIYAIYSTKINGKNGFLGVQNVNSKNLSKFVKPEEQIIPSQINSTKKGNSLDTGIAANQVANSLANPEVQQRVNTGANTVANPLANSGANSRVNTGANTGANPVANPVITDKNNSKNTANPESKPSSKSNNKIVASSINVSNSFNNNENIEWTTAKGEIKKGKINYINSENSNRYFVKNNKGVLQQGSVNKKKITRISKSS